MIFNHVAGLQIATVSCSLPSSSSNAATAENPSRRRRRRHRRRHGRAAFTSGPILPTYLPRLLQYQPLPPQQAKNPARQLQMQCYQHHAVHNGWPPLSRHLKSSLRLPKGPGGGVMRWNCCVDWRKRENFSSLLRPVRPRHPRSRCLRPPAVTHHQQPRRSSPCRPC